jgi:uncharacterized protein (DUF2164 family)
MINIEFTKQEKELLVQKLKHYFTNELVSLGIVDNFLDMEKRKWN